MCPTLKNPLAEVILYMPVLAEVVSVSLSCIVAFWGAVTRMVESCGPGVFLF